MLVLPLLLLPLLPLPPPGLPDVWRAGVPQHVQRAVRGHHEAHAGKGGGLAAAGAASSSAPGWAVLMWLMYFVAGAVCEPGMSFGRMESTWHELTSPCTVVSASAIIARLLLLLC